MNWTSLNRRLPSATQGSLLIMGILNASDSFSDGGNILMLPQFSHANSCCKTAHIIDIGAESIRPNAALPLRMPKLRLVPALNAALRANARHSDFCRYI
ncbi:MAG: hypothetical protein ACLUKN_12955 [Bacilli bacterium]